MKELPEQAWVIVRPYFLKAEQKAVDRYKEFVGSGRVSNRIGKIVPTAFHGRVELLFVVADLHQWGAFDPNAEAIHLRRKEKSGDEDLIEVATIQTLFNRGAVYVIKSKDMPDSGPLAAGWAEQRKQKRGLRFAPAEAQRSNALRPRTSLPWKASTVDRAADKEVVTWKGPVDTHYLDALQKTYAQRIWDMGKQEESGSTQSLEFEK